MKKQSKNSPIGGRGAIIPATDGLGLSALIWEPSIPAHSVVQINIGTGMRKEFYANFAAYLAEQGHVVCLWEYRGMGQSQPVNPANFPKIKMQDWGILDMTGVMDYLHLRYPDLPKILVGHSIGGQLMGLMPNHHLYKGMILLNASFGTWYRHTFPYALKSFYFFNLISPLTAPIMGRVPLRKMGVMEDLPRDLIMEWRRWCNTEGYLFPFLEKSIPNNFYDDIKVPIKAYWTTDDPIANAHTVPALMKHFTHADKQIVALRPRDFGQKRIGHFGLFSRKMTDTFWRQVADDVLQMATTNVTFNNPGLVVGSRH
jgi:predicted alpha/beta hydrolase